MKLIRHTASLLFSLIACLAQADTSSGITISTADSHTITGVYLQALIAGSCDTGTTVFSNPSSSTYGAMWTSGIALNNQSIIVGAHYLYEMINIAIYEGYHGSDGTINNATPGSNAYDASLNRWCIKLGIAGGAAVTPISSVTTALLPFASSTPIGIICDNVTIRCVASSPVTQTF